MIFFDLVKKKDIDLTQNDLRDEDLDVVTEVLQKSNVIEELNLRRNRITLADGKFTDALANNRTLRILGLSTNKIGAEGAKRLAAALKVNKTLQTIWLLSNQIGNEGAKSLADALMVNESLQVMILSDNNIGDEGAESLAASFKENQSLCRIYLRRNNIGDKGAEELAVALKCNPVIEFCYLTSNLISGHVLEKIQSILDDPNRTAKQLKMLAKQQQKTIKEMATKITSYKADNATKDEQITSLKSDLECPTKLLANILASKDKEIASLKSEVKKSKPIDTVDLASEGVERANKRRRTGNGNTHKSSLAILHEQSRKMIQVKQEKKAADTTLKGVREENEAMGADLAEVRDDLGDANDLVQQQYLAQDIWQRRFDELASLIEAGQVDGAMVSDIRNRSLTTGS